MLNSVQLNEIVRRLDEKFHLERVILFGSQARGSATERSDVDLLVIASGFSDRRQQVVKMYEALEDLRIPADIVLLNPEEFEEDKEFPGTIARPAWREGKILYERA